MPVLPKYLHAALAVAVIAAAGGCRNASSEKLAREALRSEAEDAKESLDKIKNIVVRDWALTGKDSSPQRRPLWRLQAREARIGEGGSLSPKRATLIGARAELFRDGVLETFFQAERIEFISTKEGQRLLMSGGVQAQAVPPSSQEKGKSTQRNTPVLLRAPRAEVSLRSRTVWIPVGASIEQKGSNVRVTSRTLRGDSGLKRLELAGPVEASSPRGRVRADRATYLWSARRILAIGNVRAQAPVAIGGKPSSNLLLVGDRLDAEAGAGSGLLSGKVRATAENGSASAGQVAFNWRNKTITTRGGVTLQKDGATLRAGSIETDSEFSRAVASGDVRLSKDSASMSAARLEAFDRFTRAVASGGVRLAQSTSGGQTVLRAARVQAFDGFTRAVASGDVRLEQGDATVRAGNLQAFDLRGNGRAVARNGVTLSRGDVTINAANVEATNLRDRAALAVTASGGVRARSNEGRVSSERVKWGGGRIEASGGVSMQREGATLRGDSFRGDDRFQNAVLTGNVSGSLPNGVSLSGGRIEKVGSKIIATQGVRAQQAGVTLRAARVEATISGNDVLGSGGVTLTTRDGATVNAPSARYSKSRDEAYANGGVRYSDPKRGLSLNGRSAVVRHVSDEKRREAVIEGASGRGSQQSLKDFKVF